MSVASKALAALLRDSSEWRQFFRQCCESSALRLRAQARRQFREVLRDRGHAFSPAELEDALLMAARKLLPNSPAAHWDADHASALCKDALARLGEHFAGLSEAELDRLDLSAQESYEERLIAAGEENDPVAFRAVLKEWERVGLEALVGTWKQRGAA